MNKAPFKVTCIETVPGPYGKVKLTSNKDYDVVEEDNVQYFVVNDLGVRAGYRKSRFTPVKVKQEAPPPAIPAPVVAPKPVAPKPVEPALQPVMIGTRFVALQNNITSTIVGGKTYELIQRNHREGTVTVKDIVTGQTATFADFGLKGLFGAELTPLLRTNSSFTSLEVIEATTGFSNSIVKGRKYDVVEKTATTYTVIDDAGKRAVYDRSYFKGGETFIDKLKRELAGVPQPTTTSITVTKKEITNMSSPFDALTSALKDGFRHAGASTSADLALDGAKKVFNAELLATEDGRQLAKMVIAGLGLLATVDPLNSPLPFKIPKPHLVSAYCKDVVTTSTRDFVEPKMKQLAGQIGDLMNVFAEMAKAAVSQGLASDTEEPTGVTVPEWVGAAEVVAVEQTVKQEVAVPVAVGAKA